MSLVKFVLVFRENQAGEKFYFCFSSDYSRLLSSLVQTDDFFDERIRVFSLVNKVQPPFMPSSRIGQSDWLLCVFFVVLPVEFHLRTDCFSFQFMAAQIQ